MTASLDVGCRTGEHVLMCAGLGLDATLVDLAPLAPRTAFADGWRVDSIEPATIDAWLTALTRI